jgi:hypothetical protein
MLALVPIALAFQVSVGVRAGGDSASRAKERRQENAEMQASIEAAGPRKQRPVRRIPLTDALRASAFKDAASKSLLLRARAARLQQDSLLASYDATTYQRISVGLGVKLLGRERLAMRHEDASRVQWQRGVGAMVEVKGSRSVVPIVGKSNGEVDMSGVSPIPYYPGREQLPFFNGLTRDEVDDREFVHPIAEGAEAYYTYEIGDSVTMTLPDGKRLMLREIRIQARVPKWNVSVGSFWFDEATAHLVRAVYRTSASMDVWTEAAKQDDSTQNSGRRRSSGTGRPRNGDDVPILVKAIINPMKVDISAITVEYGLYNQRFWLPRAQALEGQAQAGFLRVPVSVEQTYKYASVNELKEKLPIKAPVRSPLAALRDSLDSAKTPQLERTKLLADARAVRAKALIADRDRQCAANGTYTTERLRYDGNVTVMTLVPCDSAKLANAPELPGSIYDANEALFGTAERDDLVKALGFGLQAGWGPQLPTYDYGLSQTRYNRVEGLSSGVRISSVLGEGYTVAIGARFGLADRQFNGDFTLSRTNGRSTIHGSVYRRLEASNDWGTPLSFGASLASLLYGRDEGAYYRTWGAEFGGTHPKFGALEWKLFAEQQWTAPVNSRWTLFGGGNDSRFIANPPANTATEFGGALRLRSNYGLDPEGFRGSTDFRIEGAGGDFGYGRALGDFTVSHPLGSDLAGSLSASIGSSAGKVPAQRQFYLGGTQTIRGQTALTGVGDAFWMARAEIGAHSVAFRPIAFADLGWAGDRNQWKINGRPMSGAGVGASFLDGLLRIDLARGLYPAKQWRLDLYLESKF